jgi:general stress protein 26
MTPAADDKLRELLADFDTAMLVTRTTANKLRSRPMALADIQPSCCLWFITERHSGKLEEIARNHDVNVAMQSRNKFVSISGTATPVDDRRKVAELWNDAWKVWFPDGKDDPGLILLKVQGETGEYWDNSGTSGIKYLIEAGRAYLSGTKPDLAGDSKMHGKVAM